MKSKKIRNFISNIFGYNSTNTPNVQHIKTLHNTEASGAKQNVKDIVSWGDGDTFKLISKASSKAEGWMKSTKAMEVPKIGCVIQVTTQQRNSNGTYSIAEAITFVPSCCIQDEVANPEESNSQVIGRKIVFGSR